MELASIKGLGHWSSQLHLFESEYPGNAEALAELGVEQVPFPDVRGHPEEVHENFFRGHKK